MLTLDELEYLTTELKLHVYFLEHISNDMLSIAFNKDFDHCYALRLAVFPLKEIIAWLETLINNQY